MPLLIDGYNVLHETMPPPLAGLDEGRLCVALSRSVFRNERSVVVCDGRPKPLRASESPVDGVELVFSGAGRSADDVIIAMIEADSAPRRLTVVSSDRKIRAAGRKRRVRVWSSAEFIARLVRGLGQSPPLPRDAKPGGGLTPEQVDDWLDTFGIEE